MLPISSYWYQKTENNTLQEKGKEKTSKHLIHSIIFKIYPKDIFLR